MADTAKGRTRRTAKAGVKKTPAPAARRGSLDDEGLRHARGCPAVGDVAGAEGSRVERYESPAPRGGGVIVMERCVECGEQVQIDERAGDAA